MERSNLRKGQLAKERVAMLNLKNIKHKQGGFTLLEVLLVVAIIAILAGIVIIAINPSKNLADTRNSQRSSDVTTILNGIYQYSLDNSGSIPSGITTAETEICKTGGTCTGLVDLGILTTNGKYLVGIPSDPQCPTVCDANGVGYSVKKDANNRITVNAPDAENKTITVTR
jgi:prepilin-type N-terminal cleavage/methylation domain-containing protein